MPDLLLELGLEEIPARMIASAQAELQRRTLALLEREHLLAPGTTATSYSTPRRLAVLISGVIAQQPDLTEEVTGPAVKIAFKDGAPTPAAEAFAKKNGIAVADLKTISTPKGDYLAASVTKKGRSAAEVITSELPKEVAALYWAKNMRGIPESKQTFVRPVLWLVCILGDTVVPIEFGGRTAARASYGHRVLSSGEPFEIQSPASYLAQLEGEYVLADVEVRRHKIRKALDRVTKATRTVPSARWREDEPLVDAVTHLTEWPDVLLGSFEPDYLKLPEEVLVTVMRDHQKYFAVEDASGKLAPHFLTVTNIALNGENTAIIKQGNERVLRARFNDAQFFWNFDQKTPLTERVKLLENVTFQKELGSYAKKSERVRALAAKLVVIAASRGATIDSKAVDEAATLAKTDLTSELVKEFTELQGVIGGLYAKSQGISATAADAIYDQYLPASAKDSIPRSPEGAILGLADRIDTITGMFALGMEPTGSKDPFALRRAANSIVRILADSSLQLSLSDVIYVADAQLEVATKLNAFFSERIDFYLRDVKGFAYDVVIAVLAAWNANPNVAEGSPEYSTVQGLVERASAVGAVHDREGFRAVCKAYKRLRGIYKQALERKEAIPTFVPIFSSKLEIDVWQHIENAGAGYLADCQFGRYSEALIKLSAMGPHIHTYFDSVMVFVDDQQLREERLSLVRYLLVTFIQIADFSEIVTAG